MSFENISMQSKDELFIDIMQTEKGDKKSVFVDKCYFN